MSNPPPKPPGLHTIVQYTIVSTTSDGGENTVPRTETTKALLQPHMTVDAFLTTIDRLIASHYPGYVREEPSEVVYYPPMVANSHPSEEEAISIDKGTTICNVPAIAKRREITIASNSGSVDEFDRPYIIASSSPICLVIRRRRGSLLLAPSSQSLHQSSTSSLSRKAAEPMLQLPQDPTDAADLLIADELASIQEGRQSSSPHRHWSGSLSKPTSSEAVLDALTTEERILQTRLAAVQERAIAIKSKKATLVAQKAALQGELKRAKAGFEEAGGEENQRRRDWLEEEVECLRTEIAVQRQRESEMVTKAADEMAASPSPRRSGGGGVASPGSPYDPLFSPGAKGKATAAAPNNATTTAGKYAVANLSSDHEGAESPHHYKSHPSSHVNHHPRHPPATHKHRMDDTPRHHQDYTYGAGGDDGVAEDFGDEDHLGSGPPPPLPPREGYTSTTATSHQAAADEHQQPSPSDNHYAASPPSGTVVGSRYRSEVDQERAGRFGGGGGGMGTSRYQQHASLVPSSDPYQLQQAAAPPTNYESHFDSNTVDETSWLNPVLRKEVDSALSQVLPIPKYLQETNNNNMSSPPPPTPHVQMMNSPPQAGYNSGGATTIPTPFPRVPTMTSGGSPGSLTTSLSAYLYQMEGGSPQGLRKDLIARLGSRQYTTNNNNSGLGGSSSPFGGGGGYQPPQHIAPQRNLYGDPISNATNDDDDRDDHNYGHHQADMHAASSPPQQQQQQASSPQYQQSKYFQSTGNHHYHQHQAPSSSPFSTSTPAKGGGGYDDHVDQTPPQPQYRRPSYGALRGGGGGAQSFGSGTMRLNTNINTQGGGGGGGTTSSSYYPAAGRVGNAAGRVVPNFDESP